MHTPISIDEWKAVVESLKKRSASLIFSFRLYSIYKCSLYSKKITNLLVKFYNIIVNECYYPEQLLNILDIMIEKGKEPTLGKLQTI
jgi:hypothetical protein